MRRGNAGQLNILCSELSAVLIMLAVIVIPSASAQSKGGHVSSAACLSDPSGCAVALGVDRTVVTFAELRGTVSDDSGNALGQMMLNVTWESTQASPDCQRLISTLLAGETFITSGDGTYSIFVPACGSTTYTLTPDNPEFSWTPASRSVRVSGAPSGTAYKSGETGGGREASNTGKSASADSEKLLKAALDGTPDTGEMAMTDTGELTAEGRDVDALSAGENESKGPLRGTPTPGYAELERSAIDALWRATTGCNSLGAPLGLPSPSELAACADKPVSQRLQTAEQGRNDFNSIFGIGSSTSSGLTNRAAGDRGLPTLTTDSNGNPVLPTKEEIQAYLRGKQSEYSDDEGDDYSDVETLSGTTPEKGGKRAGHIAKAVKYSGKALKKALRTVGTYMEQIGSYLAEVDWIKTGADGRGYGSWRRANIDDQGNTIYSPKNNNKTPNPDEDQPYQYSARECEAICSGTSASYTQRQQCGCDDPSQGVKNPAGTDSGTGTQEMVEPGVNMMKKKMEPLIHTAEPKTEKETVEINDLPDYGGKGPRPDPTDPATGKTK